MGSGDGWKVPLGYDGKGDRGDGYEVGERGGYSCATMTRGLDKNIRLTQSRGAPTAHHARFSPAVRWGAAAQ